MPATILLVEDHPDNIELLRYLLAHAGHKVLLARNGAEGVTSARAHLPDLILCDLQMPVLDGYQTLAQCRADPAIAAIPIIAVTAFSMPNDRSRVLTAGFDGYFSKPIEPETFVQEIESFLPSDKRGHSAAF